MMLVSLTQASDHLRRDTTDDDSDLTLKIEAASAIVAGYIDTGAGSFLDTAGDPDYDTSGDPINVPRDVQAATLLVLGNLYMSREGGTGSEFRPPDPMSQAVISILAKWRNPVFG